MKAVRAYYETLGQEYIDALNDMIVFDAMIYSTDWHFGNSDLLIDSRTNKIIGPAPLFDHENSLFNYSNERLMLISKIVQDWARALLEGASTIEE